MSSSPLPQLNLEDVDGILNGPGAEEPNWRENNATTFENQMFDPNPASQTCALWSHLPESVYFPREAGTTEWTSRPLLGRMEDPRVSGTDREMEGENPGGENLIGELMDQSYMMNSSSFGGDCAFTSEADDVTVPIVYKESVNYQPLAEINSEQNSYSHTVPESKGHSVLHGEPEPEGTSTSKMVFPWSLGDGTVTLAVLAPPQTNPTPAATNGYQGDYGQQPDVTHGQLQVQEMDSGQVTLAQPNLFLPSAPYYAPTATDLHNSLQPSSQPERPLKRGQDGPSNQEPLQKMAKIIEEVNSLDQVTIIRLGKQNYNVSPSPVMHEDGKEITACWNAVSKILKMPKNAVSKILKMPKKEKRNVGSFIRKMTEEAWMKMENRIGQLFIYLEANEWKTSYAQELKDSNPQLQAGRDVTKVEKFIAQLRLIANRSQDTMRKWTSDQGKKKKINEKEAEIDCAIKGVNNHLNVLDRNKRDHPISKELTESVNQLLTALRNKYQAQSAEEALIQKGSKLVGKPKCVAKDKIFLESAKKSLPHLDKLSALVGSAVDLYSGLIAPSYSVDLGEYEEHIEREVSGTGMAGGHKLAVDHSITDFDATRTINENYSRSVQQVPVEEYSDDVTETGEPVATSSHHAFSNDQSLLRYEGNSYGKRSHTVGNFPEALTDPTAVALTTEPSTKLIFNAPFDSNYPYRIKIKNNSARQIAWTMHRLLMNSLQCNVHSGVLDPSGCEVVDDSMFFGLAGEDLSARHDSIFIDWINTPDGATKPIQLQWFHGPGVSSKMLPIEYNL